MDGAERCTDCSFEFEFIFLLLITVILSRYFIKRDYLLDLSVDY